MGHIHNNTTKIAMLLAVLIVGAMSGCVEPTIVPTVEPTPETISTPEPTVTPTPDIKDDIKGDIIIVFDISESMLSEIIPNKYETHLDYEKILICNILDDKDFEDDRVGMVAFGGKAYEVAGLTYLGNDAARESLKETIMTIEPKGEITTTLDQGLAMAEEMLANSAGAKDVIVVSDGNIDAGIYESSLSVAARMNNADTMMHFIHVMSSPTNLVTKFEDLARGVDGTYQQTEYPALVVISTSQATATHTLSPPSPDPTPVPTSAFVELEDEPEPTSTPIQIKNAPEFIPKYYQINTIIDLRQWSDDTIIIHDIFHYPKPCAINNSPLSKLYYIEIFIDGESVCAFEPTVVKRFCSIGIQEFPAIINLPPGVNNSGKITMIGSFDNYGELSSSLYLDGNYRVATQIRTPFDNHHDMYDDIPIYQG